MPSESALQPMPSGLRASPVGVNAMANRMPKRSAKVAKKPIGKRVATKPMLLTGGNPQILCVEGRQVAPEQLQVESARVADGLL